MVSTFAAVFAAVVALSGGQTRTLHLQVGAVVTCKSHGVLVSARVPAVGHGVVADGDGVHGSATLRLNTTAPLRVRASCR